MHGLGRHGFQPHMLARTAGSSGAPYSSTVQLRPCAYFAAAAASHLFRQQAGARHLRGGGCGKRQGRRPSCVALATVPLHGVGAAGWPGMARRRQVAAMQRHGGCWPGHRSQVGEGPVPRAGRQAPGQALHHLTLLALYLHLALVGWSCWSWWSAMICHTLGSSARCGLSYIWWRPLMCVRTCTSTQEVHKGWYIEHACVKECMCALSSDAEVQHCRSLVTGRDGACQACARASGRRAARHYACAPGGNLGRD